MKTEQQVIVDSVVARYAEAWRELQTVEKELAAVKEGMRDILACGAVSYTYADGAEVQFKLVTGHRTTPVSYEQAQEVTQYGHARMARISGAVDPKKVRAKLALGELTEAQVAELLPEQEYLQIRGSFAK